MNSWIQCGSSKYKTKRYIGGRRSEREGERGYRGKYRGKEMRAYD